MSVNLKRIHHVAYRCRCEGNGGVLSASVEYGLCARHRGGRGAVTKPDLHARVFRCGYGQCAGFFELPNSPAMGRDEQTPIWVQHITFEVTTWLRWSPPKPISRMRTGCWPVNHGIFKSIYFFDPNKHQLSSRRMWARLNK